MPYFSVSTTRKTTTPLKQEIKAELGRIIEKVPDKSEEWLMVEINDESYISFGGKDDAPAAAIVLDTFGELTNELYDMLTKEICTRIGALLDTDPKRIYVIYKPITHWGWNNANF